MVLQDDTPETWEGTCNHRWSTLDKWREKNRLVILQRCRRCQRSRTETFLKDQNARKIYTKRIVDYLPISKDQPKDDGPENDLEILK